MKPQPASRRHSICMTNKLRMAFLCALLVLASTLGISAAQYTVTRPAANSHRLLVSAALPINGTKLEMEQSWPGDAPEVGENGWPALVRDLRVADDSGRPLGYKLVGPAGWVLDSPYNGTIRLTYAVDYSALAASNWPAAREAAFADADHLVFSGRSLFITTSGTSNPEVHFRIGEGWRSIAPWPRLAAHRFRPTTTADLRGNLIVLTRSTPDATSAGGFEVTVVSMGHWKNVRSRTVEIIGSVIPSYVRMMGPERASYTVVLLPISDSGGESYRNSFAFNVVKPPTVADSTEWGQTIAHEIFHYWNGWRLRGTDYASTQWFQEGFTDYAADLALAESGLLSEGGFLKRIENNLAKYRRLVTPLDAPGNRKGPPLYAGGALVALCWDIQVRNASQGRRGLPDILRTIWQNSGSGNESYEWRDIQAALNQAAKLDWQGFYDRYIHGTEKLPLNDCLEKVGLNIITSTDGTEQIKIDPNATRAQRSLLSALINRRSK